MSDISAVRVEEYREEALQQAVRKHFAALGAAELFSADSTVLLKPNLLLGRAPEGFTTTHPLLVRAVIRELEHLGVRKITVADSPGGPYNRSRMEGIYRTCGMVQAVEGTCAVLYTDCEAGTAKSVVREPICQEFDIIAPVLEHPVIINLPKLKTHAMTAFSGGVKNLFGCVPGLRKPELHFRFPERERFGRMLVELAALVAPQLTIVDAVQAMEGDGPSAGTCRDFGWTFAARDVFALDTALCALVGIPAEDVPTLSAAGELGLFDLEQKVQFVGEEIPEDILPFLRPQSRAADFSGNLPRPLQRIGRILMEPRPKIDQRGCIGCGKCAESCPAKSIALSRGKAVIDYRGCIKCYCCHELCPVQAIGIRRFRLLK